MNAEYDFPFVGKLSLPFSERRLLLGLIDCLALNVGLFLALASRSDSDYTLQVVLDHPVWFAVLDILWFLFGSAFELFDVSSNRQLVNSSVVRAAVVTITAYLLVPYITPPLPAARSMVVVLYGVIIPFVVAGRVVATFVFHQHAFGRSTLIVGAGTSGQLAAETILEFAASTYRLRGFIEDDPLLKGTTVKILGPHTSAGLQNPRGGDFLPVVGTFNDLPKLIDEYGIQTVVYAMTTELEATRLAMLLDCLEHGIELVPMPILYEQLTGRVPIDHIGGNWYVAMPINHPGTQVLWPGLKRIADVVLSLAGLMVLTFAFPFIAAAIYLGDRGPVVYSQLRVGKGGRIYRLYKFRTMIAAAETNGPQWANKNDSRVTRVGRLLRKTHLDEIPQFLNIIRGDMSLVGPRPERPEFVAKLTEQIPFYRTRHAIRPGAISWALIKQGYGSSTEDAMIKLQYDLYYIKHQSFWLDIRIVMRAIRHAASLGGRA